MLAFLLSLWSSQLVSAVSLFPNLSSPDDVSTVLQWFSTLAPVLHSTQSPLFLFSNFPPLSSSRYPCIDFCYRKIGTGFALLKDTAPIARAWLQGLLPFSLYIFSVLILWNEHVYCVSHLLLLFWWWRGLMVSRAHRSSGLSHKSSLYGLYTLVHWIRLTAPSITYALQSIEKECSYKYRCTTHNYLYIVWISIHH